MDQTCSNMFKLVYRNNFNPLHIGAQRKKEGRCRFFAHINCVLPVLTNQCKAIFAISHREILPNNGTLQMFPLESHELALIGMREGTFQPLIFFGSDFIS